MTSDSSNTLRLDVPAAGQAQLMDQMYRLQRYFYDLTRKYYLFGRDRLISRMNVAPGHQVIEIGCGTGRNLILLARRHPDACFFGVDAASVMIETAKTKVAHRKLNVQLRQGLAEELHAWSWFNIPGFDRVVFSYSLSMIPTWSAAIDAALSNLKPGGEMWVVDFWDQAGYPRPLPALLRTWLAMFHVHHRPELLGYLQNLQAQGRGRLDLEPVGKRYAYLARFVKHR